MRIFRAFMFMLSAVVVSSVALAETSNPGRAAASGISVLATVEKIDYKTRYITLKPDQGETFTLKAPEFAHNFNQVKTGDKIRVEYSEAIALSVEKASGDPKAVVESTIERAPLGANPQGQITNTVTLTATVDAIDYDSRQITLRGPSGNLVTLEVGPQAKRFNEVKKGEQVVATYTEALAMKLEKSQH